MSTKRKSTPSGTSKNRPKSRKVEYDEEDISSEHESEVEDAEAGSNVDGEDAGEVAEDTLADVSDMPELPAPEVRPGPFFFSPRNSIGTPPTRFRDATRKAQFVSSCYIVLYFKRWINRVMN